MSPRHGGLRSSAGELPEPSRHDHHGATRAACVIIQVCPIVVGRVDEVIRVTLWDLISGIFVVSPLVASLGTAKTQHAGVSGWLLAALVGIVMGLASVLFVRTAVSRAIARLVTGKPETTAANVGVALLYFASLLLGFAATVASSVLTSRALAT